jgi:choline monooxygenase
MLDKPSVVTTRIHQELADRAGRSSEDAYAMPAEFYTSAAFLEEEIETLLRRDWMCVGHVGEVRNPGDFFTTEMLDEQLLVVRDTDDVVRVMSNVCRHRGNRVAEGSGNARKFICPYHTWTYDTTGALKAAPMMKRQTSFDQSKCGLPEFKSEIWNGWIFVDLEGDATPLASRLEGLQEVIKN